MIRKALILACCWCFAAAKCDKPPEKIDVGAATLTQRSLDAGTSFRARLSAEAVVPRFPSRERAKRMGQIRAVDTTTKVDTTFFAELVEVTPEKWRIDFEAFNRTTQTHGAEEATSTYELPDRAFFVEFGADGTTVRDEQGATPTDSQVQMSTALASVLRERHEWGEFVAAHEFAQGKIVAAPKGLMLGRFVEAMFGPVSEANATVAFFRFGEDPAKAEVAHFEVHSRFRAIEPAMTDGSYLDVEANGRVVLRVDGGQVVKYDLGGKVTPRSSTGAMLPEGSGSWKTAFEIDTPTIGSK